MPIPTVTVQVGAQTFTARARTAAAEERPRLWRLMVATMPSYQGYQEATSREIPVVIIERESARPDRWSLGLDGDEFAQQRGDAARADVVSVDVAWPRWADTVRVPRHQWARGYGTRTPLPWWPAPAYGCLRRESGWLSAIASNKGISHHQVRESSEIAVGAP